MKRHGPKRNRATNRLPEDLQFRRVLISVCVAAALLVIAFLSLTVIKALRSPHDLTSNWFVAWGTWAGGMGTVAAFLIAGASISVASAHSRLDRKEAAEIRADDDMAQARLLTIYKVEAEDSISSLATYRIENRSKDVFFDVTVPFVDSPNGSERKIERRTAEMVAQSNRLHEYIPSSDQLAPYRNQTEDEVWFTLVTVHTTDASGISFSVEYTDASGRRWSQMLGGQITRTTIDKAVPVRRPDRYQPRQQIRRLSDVEAWRMGGVATRNLEPLQTDAQFLEVIEVRTVREWQRIERIRDVEVRPDDTVRPPQGNIAVVEFRPKAPPFWGDYFHEKLAESGLRYGGGGSERTQTDKFRLPPENNVDVDELTEVIDAAIAFANDTFEQNELAAARRALDARSGRQR